VKGKKVEHEFALGEMAVRVGVAIFNQNYGDWQRYEAEERGAAVSRDPVRPDRDLFNEELNLARFADESGFDSVWTIEHQFSPYTMVTNPLQCLSYIAGITKRVHLGTMVVVLPWHHPVRVAEDVNMLDSFPGLNRDITCGAVRGLAQREFHGMGLDQNEARGRFDESLEVLRQLLATGECNFDGEFYKIRGPHLRPRPDRDLSANLRCAAGSEQTAQLIAKRAVPALTVLNVSLEVSLKSMRQDAKLRREAGHALTHTKAGAMDLRIGERRRSRSRSAAIHGRMPTQRCGIPNLRAPICRIPRERYGEMQKALRQDSPPFTLGYYRSHPWELPTRLFDVQRILPMHWAPTRSCSPSSMDRCRWRPRKRVSGDSRRKCYQL
jgi:alkanesulfonate monooxygenase SsuD/methylene tetrahydromethanopterin reductase-like flavin-dependent oxidoreductase (luciferase family)